MKCGFCKVNINPEMGAYLSGDNTVTRVVDSIHDSLFARAVTFNNGKTIAVIITLDSMGTVMRVIDRMRDTISKATGIDPLNIIINESHTHTACTIGDSVFPVSAEYEDELCQKLADITKKAIETEEESTFTWADSELATPISFVRRFRMKDGSIRTNPGWRNPDIDHPLGEADNTLRLLTIKRQSDQIMLVNFQVHADVVRCGLARPEKVETFVSADFPGYMVKALEGALENTHAMFVSGTAGNLNHINVNSPEWDLNDGLEQAEYMGNVLAGTVLQICTKARPINAEGDIQGLETNYQIPLKRLTEEQLEKARYYVDSYNQGKYENFPFPKGDMGFITLYYESDYNLKLHESGLTEKPCRVSVLKVGDFVLGGVAGEAFCEVGKAFRENSPSDYTFSLGICNGRIGYLPVKQAFDEGGYETRSSWFAPGVAELAIDNVSDLYKKLK